MKHQRAVWIVGLAAGAAAVAGLTYAATKAHASPSASTPVAPPPLPVAPATLPSNTPSQAGAVAYTLPAGQSGQTVVAVPVNGYVTLFLPQGGTWDSLTLQPSGSSVATSGNQAATFQVSPTTGVVASATAVWTDSNGKQWTDVISLPTS
jgi:hypothetical protein